MDDEKQQLRGCSDSDSTKAKQVVSSVVSSVSVTERVPQEESPSQAPSQKKHKRVVSLSQPPSREEPAVKKVQRFPLMLLFSMRVRDTNRTLNLCSSISLRRNRPPLTPSLHSLPRRSQQMLRESLLDRRTNLMAPFSGERPTSRLRMRSVFIFFFFFSFAGHVE